MCSILSMDASSEEPAWLSCDSPSYRACGGEVRSEVRSRGGTQYRAEKRDAHRPDDRSRRGLQRWSLAVFSVYATV